MIDMLTSLAKQSKKDSFVPNHVKSNLVSNYIKGVENRCSYQKIKNAAVAKLKDKLEKNGYRNIITRPKIKKN